VSRDGEPVLFNPLADLLPFFSFFFVFSPFYSYLLKAVSYSHSLARYQESDGKLTSSCLSNQISWARKYGIRINLDLHALPGSQNGWNHSGRVGSEFETLATENGAFRISGANSYLSLFPSFFESCELHERSHGPRQRREVAHLHPNHRRVHLSARDQGCRPNVSRSTLLVFLSRLTLADSSFLPFSFQASGSSTRFFGLISEEPPSSRSTGKLSRLFETRREFLRLSLELVVVFR